MLLDDPGAGAVDDLEAALVGALHDVRADAVGADDDRRAVIDVVERVDGLDAEALEVVDDALVVDDLAEGMRRLAGGRGLLGLVDRLADAVAEPGPLARCGRPGPFPCRLDYRTRPLVGPLGRRRSIGVARRAGAGGSRAAMRRMIRSVASGVAARRSRPGGQLVGEAERGPDTDRDAAAGMRQLLAARPALERAGDADRHDRRTGAQGEDRHAVPRLLERAVAAARALGEHEQGVALVEDPLGQPVGLDVGGSSGRRRGRRRAGRCQPTIGQSNSSRLPSHCQRRPVRGMSVRAEDRDVEVGGVVGGDDHRSLARDRVERALDADAGQAGQDRRACPPAMPGIHGGDVLDDRRDRRRRLRRLLGVASCAARLGVADRPDDGRDGLLERVAVGRDDPGVVGDAQRGDGAGRVEVVAPAQGLQDRLGLRAVRDRGRAPRSGAGRAPRPRRRGRASGRRRAARPCRCRGRP